MARLEKAFTITGQVNLAVFDAGLASSEKSQKHLIEVRLNVSGYAGNTIEIWQERLQFITIPDWLLGSDAKVGAADAFYSTNKVLSVTIDRDIPVGEKIQVALRCGATNKNLQGTYVYEEK